MSIKTEQHVCPLCEGTASRTVPFRDHECGETVRRETGYHWRVCLTCGNAYPSEQPSLEELQAYWNRNRVDFNADQDIDAVWQERFRDSAIWAKRTYDFVSPFVRPGMSRFLDIACGLGATVSLFKEQGWHAEGVDADPNTKSFHDRLGISVTIGQVEQLDDRARFDLISIAHAIYFVTDPRKFIRFVRGLLTPDGMFLVVLSDLLSANTDGKPGYVHTWYPTAESLIYVLEQEGFKILRSTRLKGSILVLAKISEHTIIPIGHPLRACLAHLSHDIRFCVWGSPRRFLAGIAKRILGRV